MPKVRSTGEAKAPPRSQHARVWVISLSLLLAIGLIIYFLVPEWIYFWGRCIIAGWNLGNNVVGILQALLTMILASILVRRRFKQEVAWEGLAVKVLAVLLLMAFFISTVFVAPFLELQQLKTTIAATASDTRTKFDVADVEGREKQRQTEEELSRAKDEIRSLREASSKMRLLTQKQKDDLLHSLSTATVKGKIFLRPGMVDSEAIEYGAQLEEIFKAAGFDATLEDLRNPKPDSTFNWGFTGERILLKDTNSPPPHARIVQKSFQSLGRKVLAATDPNADPLTVVIAIGGRP